MVWCDHIVTGAGRRCRIWGRGEAHPAQIMDAKPTIANRLHQPIEANAFRPCILQWDPRREAAGVDCKHRGAQQRAVFVVKRTVEKDLTVVRN